MEGEALGWLRPDGTVDPDQLAADLEAFRARLRRMLGARIAPGLRPRIDPSDLLQDTFLEATQRAGGYAAERDVPFFVWVRFLALQKLAQAHRRHLGAQKRDARRETRLASAAGPDVSAVALADVLAGSFTSPSVHLAQAERKARILETLATLNVNDREILALRHLEGLTNRECAHVLGLTDAGASRRYIRGARRFAEAMKQSGLDGSFDEAAAGRD